MEGLQRCQRMQTFEGKCISIEETSEFAASVKKAFFNVFLLNPCLITARQKAETQGKKRSAYVVRRLNRERILDFLSAWDYLAGASQNVS